MTRSWCFPKPAIIAWSTSRRPERKREPQAVTRQLLGVVQVGAGTPVTNSTASLQDCSSSVALQTLPPGMRDKVAGELRDGLKFTSFIPHPDIAESEVTGKQELVFFISISNAGVKFEVGNKAIDPQHFDPRSSTRNLTIPPGSTVS